MQRAGHQRHVSVHATPSVPLGAPGAAIVSIRLLNERSLPSNTEMSTTNGDDQTPPHAPRQTLETAIRQRIESRLHGRVRNLAVRASGGLVVLEGECTTYYTKQLAQHAAMGVLDDEHLENAIVVNVPR
jgi:hypothetical protein